MKIQQKLEKITSIIESCETYEHVQSCFSFVKNPSFFGDDILQKYRILLLIQAKVYSLRNNDLEEHNEHVKQINMPIYNM
jgi:predicted metal-binding protein